MLSLRNLDGKTREYMLRELERDINDNSLYISTRLNDEGKLKYPELIKQAIKEGNDDTLAQTINLGFLNKTEARNNKIVKVPKNAHQILAEGEFNRFYIRALCMRAIDENLSLIIYRAKQVNEPRVESKQKIGKVIENPKAILDDLRNNKGVDLAFGIPSGPNSGLSVLISE